MGLDPAVAATRLGVRRVLGPRSWWAREPTPEQLAQEAKARLTYVVACSGGADSLALLAATVFEARGKPWTVIGTTVDHGLQDGSAEHAQRVIEQMAQIGADETVSVRVHVDSGGRGIEAAAREARYAVLGEVASRFPASAVLLGHTLDDQAETVLLGLTRGSGGRSIAGMRRELVRDGALFHRPLLDVRRTETEQACRAQGIEFWEDPHNADPRFLRSRVRHDVLPVLEAHLGPGVTETLARTADQLQTDLEFIEQEAMDARNEYLYAEPATVEMLQDLPSALRSRVLRRLALDAGCPADELFKVHVDALMRLVSGSDPSKQVQLPGHVTAYRDGSSLKFGSTAVAG